jgi:hypothetical protein
LIIKQEVEMFQAFVHPSSIKIAYIVLLAKRKKKSLGKKKKKNTWQTNKGIDYWTLQGSL